MAGPIRGPRKVASTTAIMNALDRRLRTLWDGHKYGSRGEIVRSRLRRRRSGMDAASVQLGRNAGHGLARKNASPKWNHKEASVALPRPKCGRVGLNTRCGCHFVLKLLPRAFVRNGRAGEIVHSGDGVVEVIWIYSAPAFRSDPKDGFPTQDKSGTLVRNSRAPWRRPVWRTIWRRSGSRGIQAIAVFASPSQIARAGTLPISTAVRIFRENLHTAA